ncbi:MAG: Rab family GTPase [Promethearchaeota archaeon]
MKRTPYEEIKFNIKIVICGEGKVGKTSLVDAFLGNEIPEQYLPTIGNITNKKDYILKENDKKLKILISIWDLGGQRSFNPFNPSVYTNTDIAILVFDLTRPKETLEKLKEDFLETLNKYSEDFLSLYVGNKLDLLDKPESTKIAIQEILAKNDHIMLTSAKTGENVAECFELLISSYLKREEILNPDLIISNPTKEFYSVIGKNEEKLKSKLLDLTKIDSIFESIKLKPKKVEKESAIEKLDKKDEEQKYNDFLRQELDKNEEQRLELLDRFLINLSELDETINHLKKSQTESILELIDDLKRILINSIKDFEKNANLMIKLNREEFELVKVISKLNEEQSMPYQ